MRAGDAGAGAAPESSTERRHIAYGTYLARRVLAENPELWDWLEQRWAKLTASFSDGYGAADPRGEQQPEAAELAEQYEQYRRLSRRRLAALAVARTMTPAEVGASAIAAFEPEELRHVT